MGDTFSSQSQSHHGRFDDVIHKVAEAISEDRDLRNLGVELGLRNSVILRAITKNWEDGPKTTNGNNWMLRKWANTVTRSSLLLPALRSALYKVGLIEIAEKYLPSVGEGSRRWSQRLSKALPTPPSEQAGQKEDGLHAGASGHESESAGQKESDLRAKSASKETEPAGQRKSDPRAQSAPNHANLNTESDAHSTTMPDGVRSLRDRLKARYRKKYGEIKTSLVDSNSHKWLQNIFVSLVLILKSTLSKDEKTDREISIEEVYRLIEKESEKGFTTRVALLGEVGVGKSTFFSKIALDWATGKCLPDINLLFYEPFHEMEETQSFGNLVRNIFPDITESEKEQIETYIQANQRKAAILISDVDETKMNFVVKNEKNAVVSIVRGDKFQDTPVLVGTRPFVVDLIENFDSIRQLYTVIEVKGFTKEGTRQYIKQFFQGDDNSATSLIQFLEWNAMASELMAPYPIFCGILCNIWKTETKREAIEQLSTISHILKQVYFSLLELYSWKRRNSESGYTDFMKKAKDAVKIVAYVAFEGLLKDQITFDCGQQSIESRKEAAYTLYEIGILSKEKKVESRKIRLTEGKHYKEVFRFPHMLLQEFIASFYLSSMCEDSPSQFKEILEDTLLVDWEKYRYLLFFTASQGGKVGKSVMEALCQQVNDVSFIMEVAFECNDEAAFDSAKELLIHKKSVGSDFSTEHIFASHVYALETYGKQMIEEVKHRPTKGTSESTKLQSDGPYNYARALCHMPNLRSLELADNYSQNEIFFSAMATEAKKSQLVKLRHNGGSVGPIASPEYAKAIVSMPKLQNLELCDVELSDNFYPKIVEGSSNSRIVTLKHTGKSLGRSAPSQYAEAIVSIPTLQNLELCDVNMSDNCYSKMADGAPKSRIMTLKHEGGSLGPTASSQYAKAIVSLPHLQNLELNGVKLSDEFYQPLAGKASKSQITKLKHVGGSAGPTASSHYAKGLCSMPTLQTLELEDVKLHDESFYKTMATEAAKSKIEVLRHADAKLGPAASSHYGQGLFSMPNLRSLELASVKVDDEFYKCMATKAMKSEIAILRHADASLTPGSSYHYAQGILIMSKLRELELCRIKLGGGFFESMAGDASKSKIEKLRHVDADLGPDASHHYARGLCSMPKLQSLELHKVKLTDEFYSTMLDEAARSKIQTLKMEWCEVNKHILRAILSLPHLQSLSMVGRLCFLDDTAERDKKNERIITSVYELSIDGRCMAKLWKLGLHTSCPRVKKLALYFYGEDYDSSNTVNAACSPFRELTELHINWQKTLDPTEFCNAVKRSCPKLTKLTLTHIELNNDKATKIIQTMKTHPHLTIIELDTCWTDDYLDPVITEVNSEGKVTVSVTHGPVRYA